MSDASEAQLQAAILETHGARADCRMWKVNARAWCSQCHGAGSAPKGHPDIAGIFRGGRAFYIEVKKPKGVVSQEQRAFHDMIRRYGGRVCVARSVQDVSDFLLGMSVAS